VGNFVAAAVPYTGAPIAESADVGARSPGPDGLRRASYCISGAATGVPKLNVMLEKSTVKLSKPATKS
jgi:hypothetical protein